MNFVSQAEMSDLLSHGLLTFYSKSLSIGYYVNSATQQFQSNLKVSGVASGVIDIAKALAPVLLSDSAFQQTLGKANGWLQTSLNNPSATSVKLASIFSRYIVEMNWQTISI